VPECWPVIQGRGLSESAQGSPKRSRKKLRRKEREGIAFKGPPPERLDRGQWQQASTGRHNTPNPREQKASTRSLT